MKEHAIEVVVIWPRNIDAKEEKEKELAFN